jgi:hypothetical protein
MFAIELLLVVGALLGAGELVEFSATDAGGKGDFAETGGFEELDFVRVFLAPLFEGDGLVAGDEAALAVFVYKFVVVIAARLLVTIMTAKYEIGPTIRNPVYHRGSSPS